MIFTRDYERNLHKIANLYNKEFHHKIKLISTKIKLNNNLRVLGPNVS